MITSVGIAAGLAKTGLLDSLLYISGLSGGAWATVLLAFTLARGKPFDSLKKIEHLKEELMGKISHPLKLVPSKENLNFLALDFFTAKAHKQEITPVNFYSIVLEQNLLGKIGRKYTLSMLKEPLTHGVLPFPIVTTVLHHKLMKDYIWFEATPLEFGSTEKPFQLFIPIWATDRKFYKGISVTNSQEPRASYFMGTTGSAFAFTSEHLLRELIDKDSILVNVLGPTLRKIVTQIKRTKTFIPELAHKFEKSRRKFRKFQFLYGGRINNFVYKLPEIDLKITRNKHLNFADAGLDYNLPLYPCLRPERKLDIIIVWDASGNVETGVELQKAIEHAKRNKLRMPRIDVNRARQTNISIFGNPDDPTTPTIIYLPKILNQHLPEPLDEFKPDASTLKFKYTPEEFDQYTGYAESTILRYQCIINTIIKKKALAKQRMFAHAAA